tara:strand:- start:389 stop:3313 length:2925 start_codon:yes stop_codon:yes gene_type:complete
LTTPLTAKLTRPLTGAELEELFLEKFKFTLGSELLYNGDFELDTSWNDFGSPVTQTRSTEVVRSGTYSRKITSTASGKGIQSAQSSSNLNLTAGNKYRVSAWIYAVDGGGSANIGSGIGNTDQGVFTSRAVTEGQWTNVTYDAIATASGYVSTYLSFFTSGDTKTFYVDDVSVKEVTKQAPVAAFSLRKLGDVSPYAARIRRSSDNTEAQVFFDASDRVSESSVVRNTSQNLLSYSEDFGQWTNNGGGTASKAVTITDPFGGNNAWAVKGDTTNNWAGKFASISGMTTGTQYTVSLYLKKGTSTLSKFGIYDNNTSPNTINLDVAWSASGVPTNNTATTSALATNIKIEEVGTDGWYRCSFNAAALNVDGSQSFVIEPDRNASSDGTVYAFGAQLEETVTYLSTPNILYSEDFNTDAGGWLDTESGGSNTTLSQETTNPLSGSGSLKIALSNTGTSGGYPRVRKNTGTAFRTGIKYILSFKAKALSGTVECDIRFGTASTNMYWATDQTFTTTEQTYTYTDTFDTLPTAGTDAIQFIFDGTKGPFELLIDDVKVEIFDNAIPSEYISTPVVSNDGLTFTESTLDTFVGGENKLTYSEQFSSWGAYNAVRTADNSVTDPFGGTSAYKLNETAVTDFQFVDLQPVMGASPHTFSAYLKSGERTTASLLLTQAGNVGAIFDLSAGTVSSVTGTGNTAAIEAVGSDGWFRCSITNNGSADLSNNIRISPRNGSLSSITGEANKGIYIFGAQLNTNSLKKYQKTSGTARDGNAGIVVLYNQTGGEDIIHDTQARQPLLYSAGLLVKANASPSMKFDGTDDSLRFSDDDFSDTLNLNSLSTFLVFKHDVSDATGWALTLGTNAGNKRWYMPNLSTGTFEFRYGSHNAITTSGNINVNLATGVAGLNSAKFKAYLNGSELGERTVQSNSSDTGVAFIGAFDQGSSHFNGKISELVIFDTEQNTNREAIEKDIANFHNITLS